ncbi:hypothetical protein [Streptomyces sp. 16-176A]|uniref:hypothetical protein n=1 Tax=Streptomyces sp. 16-176A TaxID=2530458 RepID=UPI00345DCEFB
MSGRSRWPPTEPVSARSPPPRTGGRGRGRQRPLRRGEPPARPGTQIAGVTGGAPEITAALGKDADRASGAADSGTYDCGVAQYRGGDFDAALATMNEFTEKNPHARNRARAEKIAIATEIAETVPAAASACPPSTRAGASR